MYMVSSKTSKLIELYTCLRRRSVCGNKGRNRLRACHVIGYDVDFRTRTRFTGSAFLSNLLYRCVVDKLQHSDPLDSNQPRQEVEDSVVFRLLHIEFDVSISHLANLALLKAGARRLLSRIIHPLGLSIRGGISTHKIVGSQDLSEALPEGDTVPVLSVLGLDKVYGEPSRFHKYL
jgi:hypothetical protein